MTPAPRPAFDLMRLLGDVFDPAPDERVLVLVDLPRPGIDDTPDWAARRAMAREWLDGFRRLGCNTAPLLTYPVTSGNNADLPEIGICDGIPVAIEPMIRSSNIVVAMTTRSATAPLSMLTRECPGLRVASMPGVLKRMEATALAANYAAVATRTRILAEKLTAAHGADVEFDTGHRIHFDLRHRTGHADDGMCRRDKQGIRLINLPSGEAFIVPYEGEIAGDPSRTAGQIPVSWQGDTAILTVRENRIVDIAGGRYAESLRAHFDVDPARRNIAELGLGCNDAAIVAGCVLEDEKAGFHWAYGRSEHLGGVTGPAAFTRPDHVVHHDIVYAAGCPIGIRSIDLIAPDGARERILAHGAYTLW